MKTSRNSSRKRRVLAVVSIAIILVFLVSIEWYILQGIQKQTRSKPLDVKISPRDTDLSVGQVKTFYSVVKNGSPPYETKWYSNGTFLGVGQQINYTFRESAKYVILSVNTLDSLGNYGFDSTYVYNPTNINVNLGDIPSHAYFTIKTDGINYWAVRYDGYKAYEGTVAHTVINNALGSLTSGRTSKERVALCGTFIITGSITPSSYTILDLSEAKLTTTDETLKVISIYGSGFSNAEIHIDIIGGHIIGPGTYGSTLGKAISCEYANHTRIEGVTVRNFCGIGTSGNFGNAIWMGRGYYNVIHGCKILNCRGTTALSFYDQAYSIMSENFIDGGANLANTTDPRGGDGIYCGDTTYPTAGEGNQIINNVICNWGGYNITFGRGHGIYVGVKTKDVLVSGNVLYQPEPSPYATYTFQSKGRGIMWINNHVTNVSKGMNIIADGSSSEIGDVIVEGNIFRNVGTSAVIGRCIVFETGGLNPIYGVKITNNKFLETTVGIDLTPSSAGFLHNVDIISNEFNNIQYAIELENSNFDHLRIISNTFTNISNSVFYTYGTPVPADSIVCWNVGFRTEASGIALDKVDGSIIATGLALDISWLMVSVNRTGIICTATYSGTTIILGMRWSNGTAVSQGTTVYWEARSWNYP